MYEYRFINKQLEGNITSYTLLIDNVEGGIILASYRIEKTFFMDPKLIDQEFLRSEAQKEINRIVSEQETILVEEDLSNGNIS